jgi:HEAT repeat protein
MRPIRCNVLRFLNVSKVMLLNLVACVALVGAQDPHEKEIGVLLSTLKNSESNKERNEAAKALEPWIWPPREGANGFSDATVDRPSRPQKLSNDLYDSVVTALADALHDTHPDVRKTAAEALGWVTGSRPAIQAAVLSVLKTKDPALVWFGLNGLGRVAAPADQAVPLLIPLLDQPSDVVRDDVAHALGRYGAKSRAAVPALLKRLPLEEHPWPALYALGEIGFDEAQAKELAAMKLNKPEDCDDARFVVLTVYPDLALPFLNARPKLFEKMISPIGLFDLVVSVDPKLQVLRKAVLDRPDLPVVAMAWSQDPRFQAAIQERIKKANKHQATFLAACARSCGAAAERIIAMNEKDPGSFKPKSGLPGSDPSRKGKGGGHGDGYTDILVTGRLTMADGSPAVEPVFINENDRMLLGTREESRGPLRFDPKTGRFVFYSSVFAAYSMDGKQAEPGPYETGSAQVRIEAKGAKPLVLHFWDEMPDVAITLSPAK